NRKTESPNVIWSPWLSQRSLTDSPLTCVPLRLSRSRTRNRPSWWLIKQCRLDTDGSLMGNPLAGSRPKLSSVMGRLNAESFRGPDTATSLGFTSSPYVLTGGQLLPAPGFYVAGPNRADSRLSDWIVILS